MTRAGGVVLSIGVLLFAPACVEDAFQDYLAHRDGGSSGGPDGSVSPADGGAADSGGMPADSGAPDAGSKPDAGAQPDGGAPLDAGSKDAGATLDAGACIPDAGCTSDWETFLRCGPGGQLLCPPTSLGFQGNAAHSVVHGPADNFDVSAVAFALGTAVWVGYAADGGLVLTGSYAFATPVVSLAVADGHDIDANDTSCADALVSLSDGTGGYLVGCAGGSMDAGTFASMYAPGSADALSWMPIINNSPNLGLASASPPFTAYPQELSIEPGASPQKQWPAFDIQALSGAPGWLWALPDGGLGTIDFRLIATADIASPRVLQPSGTAMTAAGGGAAVVSLSGGQLFGFFVNATHKVSLVGTTNPGAFILGGIARRARSTLLVRVACLDATGTPAVFDLDLTASPPTWAAVAVPPVPAQVFAAPLDPHMLLMRDGLGNLRIAYLP